LTGIRFEGWPPQLIPAAGRRDERILGYLNRSAGYAEPRFF
jgi:hypothetical protein